MRRLRTFGLFILLGALATTLISWAFAVLGSTPRNVGVRPGDTGPHFVETGEILPWPLPVPADWPNPMVIDERAGRGLRLLMATSASRHADLQGVRLPEQRNYRVAGAECGWPLLAMRTTNCTATLGEFAEVDRTPSIALPQWLHDFADRHTWGYYARRALPLTPIWPGFLIDTAIFASAFWLLLRSLPFVRRFNRWRNRQCLACGYPIGTSSICTECGAAVTARA